jgi:hypothetical protein
MKYRFGGVVVVRVQWNVACNFAGMGDVRRDGGWGDIFYGSV